MMKKKPVYMTEEELNYLQHILWHFVDFMAGDDRPDHSMGILRKYRSVSDEQKQKIYSLAGRMKRLHRKWMNEKKN